VLSDALLLYHETGEKIAEPDDTKKAEQLLKQKEARDGATLLLEKSMTIQKQVEKQKQAAKTGKRSISPLNESPAPSKKTKTTAPVVSEAEEAHHDAEATGDAEPTADTNASQGEKEKRKAEIEEAKSYIDYRVAKYFDEELFFGTVGSFTPAENTAEDVETDLWQIDYDDGDCEVRHDIELEFMI